VTIRGVGSAVLSLALVLGAAACDDNPLSEGREDGAFFQLNPVNAIVEAGDTTKIVAIVMNQYGTPTNQAVTAEPCDSKVTATADPNRSGFESPETFLVIGQALGVSCVVVRGGGLVDTAVVRVVPVALSVADLGTINSGESVPLSLEFFGFCDPDEQPACDETTGLIPVSGLTAADFDYEVLSPSVAAVNAEGVLAGQAPGTTQVVASLSGFGVTRVDTFTVSVQAGAFTGTVAQSAGRGGQILTFTEGSFAFDEDTKVAITGANDSTVYLDVVGNTVIAAIPFGTPSGTALDYAVINMGPGQVAGVGTFTTTAANSTETWTGEDDPDTAPLLTVGEAVVAQIGGTDEAEYYAFTVTEAGVYELQVDWNNDADIDIGLINSSFTAYIATGWTAANPEHAEGVLEPGTYYIEIYNYDDSGNANTTYRMRLIPHGPPEA
jgi:hypothetical protein